MIDTDVSISIEEVFTNKTGEFFREGEKCGRGNDIKIMYPKYISFMDETGCNTSQNKDGHNAGKKKSWELITSQGQNATAPTTGSP